jgi:hypothetical protein
MDRPLFRRAALLAFLLPSLSCLAQVPGSIRSVSNRVTVAGGEGAIISGFIITGAPQTIVARGLGPCLTRYGVAGALPDPVLELHNANGSTIATNDNWPDTQAAQFKQGGAYRAYQPPTTLEPAIAITLQPGAYTAIVRGKNGVTGVALAEVYVVSDPASSTVSALSCRAQVGTGENVLIGGLTIDGGSNVPVILRASGPSLAAFGVTNTLTNPVLELHDSEGDLIGYCDNWRNDSDQARRIWAAHYAPSNSNEPALAVTLPPGSYTAIVRGSANTTGIALLEAYQLTTTEGASTAPTPAPTPLPPPPPAPPLPRGVFSLVKAGRAIDPSTLTNANVDGISLRQTWADLEPSEGIYSWSYFDTQIARARAAGKQVSIRVGTGADSIPLWVMNAVRAAGGNTFTFTDSAGQHTIPVFWDPALLAKKKAMIAALGARYTNNPTVKVFSTSCANASSDDWAVPHNNIVDPGYAISEILRWFNDGYTSQKMIDAGKAVIDASMIAFPNQLVSLPINSNGNALDYPNDDNYVARTIITNARSDWGSSRLIVAKNSFSAITPLAPPPSTSWGILSSSRPATAGQALWFSFGDQTYRNNGGTACAPSTSLQNLVNAGVAYGVSYIELYEVDVINLPAVIAYAHSRF